MINKESSNIGEVRENIVVPLLENKLHISKIIKIYTNYIVKNKNELINDISSYIEDDTLNVILIPRNDYIDIETRYKI